MILTQLHLCLFGLVLEWLMSPAACRVQSEVGCVSSRGCSVSAGSLVVLCSNSHIE